VAVVPSAGRVQDAVDRTQGKPMAGREHQCARAPGVRGKLSGAPEVVDADDAIQRFEANFWVEDVAHRLRKTDRKKAIRHPPGADRLIVGPVRIERDAVRTPSAARRGKRESPAVKRRVLVPNTERWLA